MSADYVLTEDSARRVADAVKFVEGMTRGSNPERSQPRTTSLNRFFVTTSAIGAGSQSARTLGSGTGTMQLVKATVTGSTTTYSYAAIPGVADQVLLNGGASIASGRLVEAKPIDGFFVIDVDYC